MESLLIWMEDTAVNDYDRVTMENNELFPLSIFENRFCAQSRVVAIVASSTQLGLPIVRRRLFATALSNRTLVWVGPNTNEEIYADFLVFSASRQSARATCLRTWTRMLTSTKHAGT